MSEIEGDAPATPPPFTTQPVTTQPVAPQQAGNDTTILPPPAVEAETPAVPPEEPAAAPFDESDPFANWPEAVSSTVIEDAPPEGESVEHVRGEVDVPDGYTLVEGSPLGDRRSVAVIVSRFNGGITNRLLHRALEALTAAGVAQDAITVVPVPGAFELPLAAMALAKTRRYACIVALGTIVRGETAHFEYVAAECASGLQLAGIETGIPVAFGVLTVDNVAQAEARVDRAAWAVAVGARDGRSLRSAPLDCRRLTASGVRLRASAAPESLPLQSAADVQGLRNLWQETRVWEPPLAFDGGHQAPVRPEPAACSHAPERHREARVRLHPLPQGRQSHQGNLGPPGRIATVHTGNRV